MQKETKKMKVLFLCTGNSCRSQMAEGFAKHFHSELIESHSAGITKHGLNPMAVKAMSEVGIDISQHSSKTVEELASKDFDLVVTVCGHANETCPNILSDAKILHVGFDDPPKLAKEEKSEAEGFKHYQRVRDEIGEFIKDLPSHLHS